MIKSRKDLKAYLEADKRALGRRGKKPELFDLVWKFEISLRKNEYYTNCKKSIIWKPFKLYNKVKFHILGILCGYEIPINCIDEGLSIAHKGTIVINHGAHIGKNCRMHVGVNIGTAAGCSDVAPIIGDNVYLAPGVKLYGPIKIASGIIIGANAVVTKSFTEENICIAGVPARKISDRGRFDIAKRNRALYGYNTDSTLQQTSDH